MSLLYKKKKKKTLNNIKEHNWNLRGRSGHNRNKLKISPKSDSDLQNIGKKMKTNCKIKPKAYYIYDNKCTFQMYKW